MINETMLPVSQQVVPKHRLSFYTQPSDCNIAIPSQNFLDYPKKIQKLQHQTTAKTVKKKEKNQFSIIVTFSLAIQTKFQQ